MTTTPSHTENTRFDATIAGEDSLAKFWLLGATSPAVLDEARID